MLRKNYIAPSIFLIALAFFYVASTIYFMYGARFNLSLQPLWIIMTVFWPLVMIVESIVYWRIRKFNISHKASWSHVLLFAFAFVSFYIKNAVFSLYDEYTPGLEMTTFIRNVTMVQILTYWASLIAAHIFFFHVLRKTRTQKRFRQPTDPTNLLDDVLT